MRIKLIEILQTAFLIQLILILVSFTPTSITLPEIYFHKNSTCFAKQRKLVQEMKPKEVIREIYKVLNENPDILILQVSGHSDFSEKDSTLSKKRALKITQKLVSMGINHSRLNPVGYGDKKPVVKQSEIISFVDKKEIRAAQLMNRRVEFLISKMKMR